MLSSTSDKVKLFAEKFSKNSNLDDSGIPLPLFFSQSNLKLLNISVTPSMIKKVITNLDLSNASGLDGIPVVVLKNCESELSYILAELFNKCLKEFCSPDSRLLLYISDRPDNVICDIAIYADDTTLYSKCDQASNLR